MDLLLEETWGTGYFQKRSLFINTVIILPLQGLYFHNLFFGQELDHACDENNKILEQYSFNFNSSSSRIARNSSDSCAQECSMESSYANEFNFLCEDAAHRTTILSYFLFCTSIGVLLNGIVYDAFGRRKTAIFYALMSMFAYFGLVTSGTSLQFKICSCVLGICVSALGSYPNMMELSKKSWKWMIGLVNSGMWTASVFWLILVTYFIRDWRLAFKVYSSPMLIAVFYIFYYPESPRWLLEQGRIEEAVDWIMKIAKTNGVQIERSSILEQLQALKPKSPSEKHEEETICNYLKRTAVSGRFFILIWIHSCAMLLWYNIVFATGQMHCCIYVTFAVMVLLEGPLRISYNAILLKRIRRKGIAFFLSASSVFFMIMLLLQKYEVGDEFWIPKLFFGVASKLMIQSYMSYMFTMVSEVSPTFIRARAMSALLAFGNLSSTCAPLILSFFGTSTPIFALIALLSATLIFLLPPVIKSDLPDSLDDAEALALTATRIFAK